jgi:hypothetical protein
MGGIFRSEIYESPIAKTLATIKGIIAPWISPVLKKKIKKTSIGP